MTIGLVVWGSARALLALLSMPLLYLSTHQEFLDASGEYEAYMHNQWLQHCLVLAVDVLAAVVLWKAAGRVAAFLLPSPAMDTSRSRPWIEAGIAMAAVMAFLPALEGLLQMALLPFESSDMAGWPHADTDLRPDLAVLGVATLLLFLPRLGRALAPARHAERDA